ncbi:MAG: hypothetical protein ABII97_03310 [Patescibacteria group bacterium]
MFKIEYDLRFRTSVYQACEAYGNLYVAGSLWDRRKVLYTKEIAKKTRGILHIVERGGRFRTKEEIIFPHMAYTVTDMLDGRLFVGCKHKRAALSLIDSSGNILQQNDDENGRGSYGVVFDEIFGELLLATRTGKLEILDSFDLSLKTTIQLASSRTRLWALALDFETGIIFASDYDGGLYFLHLAAIGGHEIFSVEELYFDDIRLGQGFKPAVWGLEIVGFNEILIGTRWGDIFLLEAETRQDISFERLNSCSVGEDVSCIRKFRDGLFLVGTRYGKVYVFDIERFKLTELVIEIKPAFQKENAVWTMTRIKDGILACFADGHVCKIVED